jgi:hypothetical protein
MKKTLLALAAILIAGVATAKLPPLSEEAAAKAAVAKEKTAHDGKVSAYRLCLAQDKVVAKFADKAKAVSPAPCVNPGAFVAAAPAAPAAAVASAPAPAAAMKK